jgi:hypothetical protein
MHYVCNLLPLNKLPVTSQGTVVPLCDKCAAISCDNPIVKTKVSELGITKEHKLYSTGSAVMAVVGCEGFTIVTKEEDDENRQDI